jgi:hypothetical protein
VARTSGFAVGVDQADLDEVEAARVEEQAFS